MASTKVCRTERPITASGWSVVLGISGGKARVRTKTKEGELAIELPNVALFGGQTVILTEDGQ
ncbi:MAG: hypothetical protein ACPGWS_05605, partial [Solirubrobacterales bacterium]